jgi:hypothetical protein
MKVRSLVMGSCAALVALALTAPTAQAGWPKPPKPRDTTPPTTPTGLRVVSVTDDSVTLRWNASTDNSGTIQRYLVNGIYHEPNILTKTIGSLVPNWTQTYTVIAQDAAGNSSGTASIVATTAPDVTPPTAPSALRLVSTNSPSSISLAWNKSTDRWAFGYQILMDGQVIASESSLSTRLRHLPPGTTHTFTVRARDHSGGNISGESNALTVTLPASDDITPPSVPTNLTAEDLDDFCGSVILRWGQSTDNVDGQSVLEYEIYRNGVFFLLATGTGIKGIYGGEGTNTWTVKAVDRSGNTSAASNGATVTVFTDQNQC